MVLKQRKKGEKETREKITVKEYTTIGRLSESDSQTRVCILTYECLDYQMKSLKTNEHDFNLSKSAHKN